MTTDEVTTAWEQLHTAVNEARSKIAAMAPDAATAAEGEAYLMRLYTSCLADACLGHLLCENGLTQVLATRGGPNPDFLMAVATLDTNRTYHLEGWLNGSERVGVGLYRYTAGGADISAYTAFDSTTTNGNGRFELTLSPEGDKPQGLTIAPDAKVMIVRTLHRDHSLAPARLHLNGASLASDLHLAQGSMPAALTQVSQSLKAIVPTFLEWSAVTSTAKNAFHLQTPAMRQSVQGDPDIHYFIGSFNLAGDEWLDIELPPGLSGYWSLHAYNFWCESLPGAGIGDNVATQDSDGYIRIALGPGGWGDRQNRIDTLGRQRGVLIFRSVNLAALSREHLCPQATVRLGTVSGT